MGILLSFYYEKARSFIDLCGDPTIGIPWEQLYLSIKLVVDIFLVLSQTATNLFVSIGGQKAISTEL